MSELERRITKVEQTLNPRCPHGTGQVVYVVLEQGEEPEGPQTCPHCGQRLVLRLRWPENSHENVFFQGEKC